MYSKITVKHSDLHEYVRTDFSYLRNEKAVQFNMTTHVKEALSSFPEEITKTDNTPAVRNLSKVNEECENLGEKASTKFHSEIAKLSFVGKRVRPDIIVVIAFLSTRVSKPDTDDWKKLKMLL